MTDHILEPLNASQRRAATAVRGPVCILAGAGTGKTTTITRRIAYQIAAGTHPARSILAVTFTDRAANEMRVRLGALGAGSVRAKTFHAEALAQIAAINGQAPVLLDSKAPLIAPLVQRLPAPYKFRPVKDVAQEIERAKNRRVAPSGYIDDVDGHHPPLPPDLMARVYGEYEARKRRAGRADFEDLLELCITAITEDPKAADRVRERYAAFTVDEYQDVNLLQQTLLESWLQGRDEVCVVGDDYQSIFGFTGATPAHLLGFPERHPGATVVALEDNYRSTPDVLEVANRLVPRMGGRQKVLRATKPDGPEPVLAERATGPDEVAAIVDEIRRLRDEGTKLEEIAVLYRINARSEDFEEALAAAGVPYQVRDGAFLRRPGPRAVLARLRRADQQSPARQAVERAAREVGWHPDAEPETEEEAARQADLQRLVSLASGEMTTAAFLDDLRARFDANRSATGVVLSTYHRAKGLEFDAVFLPRMEERELPFALARGDDEVAEERRLLYVGITRARRHLALSWTRFRDGKAVRPSRFVDELVPRPTADATKAPEAADPELFTQLRAWRARLAVELSVPAYVVLHDATLRAICERRPASLAELGTISGIGPAKLARYGSDVLRIVGAAVT